MRRMPGFFLFQKVDSLENIIIQGMNLTNQVLQLNFFFIVIRSMILKNEISYFLKGKWYWGVFLLYTIIISFISYFLCLKNFDPYNMIIILNGCVGFFYKYSIPKYSFYQIK